MKEVICKVELGGGICVREFYSPIQELVRCKDCEHKGISYECILDRDLEEYGSHRTQEYDNWFCADGKRKSAEEEP